MHYRRKSVSASAFLCFQLAFIGSGPRAVANKLAVIVGAGASQDCVAEGAVAEFDTNWRPPLTADLFEGRTAFNRILSKYPKANAVSEIIRTRLRNSEALEDILKDLMSSENLQV